jgi:hypothetical protein
VTLEPGTGMEKIRIRDKHPRSATQDKLDFLFKLFILPAGGGDDDYDEDDGNDDPNDDHHLDVLPPVLPLQPCRLATRTTQSK